MEENDLEKNSTVILIGGSAGSLEVLMYILPHLKPIRNFAIVIILHRKSGQNSSLEDLIARKTIIPIALVEDKVKLKSGFIYIAPPDYHLLFEKNRLLSLEASEKVNYSQLSIDVSFESAALAFGKKCIGILLSGANTDGTLGLKAIQNVGGIVILQNPENAIIPFMPKNALTALTPNHILEVSEIFGLYQFPRLRYQSYVMQISTTMIEIT
jgi:two-component system chemotaxis response regulator CheB